MKNEMDEKTIGALIRIIKEVKEYRKLPTNMIGGNDIQLVEDWIGQELGKNFPF